MGTLFPRDFEDPIKRRTHIGEGMREATVDSYKKYISRDIGVYR